MPKREAFIWCSLFPAFALLNFAILSGLAGGLGSTVLVVPAPDAAVVVSAKVPRVRIGVPQFHADEPDEVINARAIALRHATDLIFDRSNESLRLAMFRERLQMQGVVANKFVPQRNRDAET